MSLDAAISGLVARLETVTARLESVEKQLASGGAAPAAAAAAPATGGDDIHPTIAEYDALVAQHIPGFLENTQKIGNDNVKKIVGLIEDLLKEQRRLLVTATKSKKPADADLPKLLGPMSKLMGDINNLRDSNRPDKQFNWLSSISEGTPAFGWVCVAPTPGPYIKEYVGNAMFYGNKILMQFKKTDENQVNWVNGWKGFLTELMNFVKKNHTTGLVWNARGGDALKNFEEAASGGGAAPAGGPPSAPPPPKEPLVEKAAPKPTKKASPSALFAEINKGGAVTSGLKKVTKDMKTKNRPAEERKSVVPAIVKKAPASQPKYGRTVKKMPPKFELEGNKWVVEFQEGAKNLVIEETERKQTVYVYKCNNTVLQIKGKVNNITIDSCKKFSCVFDTAIASFEIVNSASVEGQVTGKVPSISVDKVSSANVILSKDCLDVEIITAKSDSVNVSIPGPDGDLVEMAVPEQFKTTIVDGALKTENIVHV